MSAKRPLVIVGPTAVGKTALAIKLSKLLNGELVGTDSMQIYRGMDIGTAKPTALELGDVRHHMLDLRNVQHSADVAEFQELARQSIEQIRKRDRLPIVVGGSVLYVNAVLDNFEFPGTNAEIRAKYELLLENEGAASLHSRLEVIDPDAASRISATNGRRIVRALEVNEITGKRYQASLENVQEFIPSCRVGLEIDRQVLDQRITMRIDSMFAAGFIQEVESLLDQGLAQGVTARRAIGYSQVLSYLLGELSFDDARAQMIYATSKFARRQQRWFRQDPRIAWFAWDAPNLAEQVSSHFDVVLSSQ